MTTFETGSIISGIREELGCFTCDAVLDNQFETSGLPQQQCNEVRDKVRRLCIEASEGQLCGGGACRSPYLIEERVPRMIAEAEEALTREIDDSVVALEAEVAVEVRNATRHAGRAAMAEII